MNQYNKRIFLNTCSSNGVAEPFTFTTDIDAALLTKLFKLRDILKETGAECIYLQTQGVWSTYEYQQNAFPLEETGALIERMQVDATDHGITYVVVSMTGIYFSTSLYAHQREIETVTDTVPFVALKNDDVYDPSELAPLLSLYTYAYAVDGLWKSCESIHWQNAEDLIGMLKSLPAALMEELQAIKPIVSYAESTDDWESGYVSLWPQQTIKCLEHFFYGGDNISVA